MPMQRECPSTPNSFSLKTGNPQQTVEGRITWWQSSIATIRSDITTSLSISQCGYVAGSDIAALEDCHFTSPFSPYWVLVGGTGYSNHDLAPKWQSCAPPPSLNIAQLTIASANRPISSGQTSPISSVAPCRKIPGVLGIGAWRGVLGGGESRHATVL